MAFIGHIGLDGFSENQKKRLEFTNKGLVTSSKDDLYIAIRDLMGRIVEWGRHIENRLHDIPLLELNADDKIPGNLNNIAPRVLRICAINVEDFFNNRENYSTDKMREAAFNQYKARAISWDKEEGRDINADRESKIIKQFNDNQYVDNVAYHSLVALTAEMKERFNITTFLHNHKDIDPEVGFVEGTPTQTLFCCYPNRLVKQDGKWTEEKKEKAAAQFFGFLVAKGMITEDALYDSGIMLGKQHREILSVIKQLKDEGVEPIFKKPLHDSIKNNKLER